MIDDETDPVTADLIRAVRVTTDHITATDPKLLSSRYVVLVGVSDQVWMAVNRVAEEFVKAVVAEALHAKG